VFLGTRYWQHTKPVYPLLQQLALGEDYGALICLTDSVAEAVARITAFTPAR
jgi:hypothetical protein